MGAAQLVFVQRLLLRPGVVHEVDVLQEPGVVVFADPGGAGLRRRLALQPGHELVGRNRGRSDGAEVDRRGPAKDGRGASTA